MRTKQLRLPNGHRIFYLNRREALQTHRDVEAYFRHGIRVAPGDVVLDVGANIGLFMLHVHWRCPTARVYSFEPIPRTFEVLRRNAQRHHPELLQPFCHGLAERSGHETFDFFPRLTVISTARASDMWREFEGFTNDLPRIVRERKQTPAFAALRMLPSGLRKRLVRAGFGWFAASEQVRCRVEPLSHVLRTLALDRVDLLKIDVERAEQQVLEGIGPEDWARIRQIVLEVHDLDGRLALVEQLLAGHGFDEVVVDQEPLFKDGSIYMVYARRSV